jgi:hypothetical protein
MVRAAARPGNRLESRRTRSGAIVNAVQVVDIAHAIQLALAPVFLLSGIAAFLGVLTSRLARLVDRARNLEREVRQATAPDPDHAREQLSVMARRSRLINVAITLATISGLLIAMVVALLFSGTFVPINLAAYVAVLFVVSMTALVGAFLSFLLEVRIAIRSLRIGHV